MCVSINLPLRVCSFEILLESIQFTSLKRELHQSHFLPPVLQLSLSFKQALLWRPNCSSSLPRTRKLGLPAGPLPAVSYPAPLAARCPCGLGPVRGGASVNTRADLSSLLLSKLGWVGCVIFLFVSFPSPPCTCSRLQCH